MSRDATLLIGGATSVFLIVKGLRIPRPRHTPVRFITPAGGTKTPGRMRSAGGGHDRAVSSHMRIQASLPVGTNFPSVELPADLLRPGDLLPVWRRLAEVLRPVGEVAGVSVGAGPRRPKFLAEARLEEHLVRRVRGRKRTRRRHCRK